VSSCLASVLAILPALAQAQSASQQAAAQQLFEDAKKLMAKGEYPAACQKFADSQKNDPAPGTQFNLANCYEKNGQSASAWATFKSAAAAYRANNRAEWETKARDRAAQLEPKLVKIAIVVPPESNVAGLQVRRDGNVVGASELGTSIPVDPGDHTVEATAPGKKPWKTTAKAASGGGEQRVSVGPLEAEIATIGPVKAPASIDPPITSTSEVPLTKSSPQKTIGYVTIGVAAAGFGVGAATGVMAMSKNKSSTDACPNDGACSNREAVDANKSARDLGTISTVAFIVGGVGLAAGAILVLTAPASAAPKTGGVRIVPSGGPEGAGLTALGVF